MNVQRNLPRLLIGVAISAAIVIAIVNRSRFDPEALDAWLSGLGLWAPAVYIAVYAIATVVFLPGSILTLLGGALFGPFLGSVLSLVGATIGATLAFVVARYMASDWIAKKAGGPLKRLIDGVEAEGWRFVALVRLVPLFPFNLTNYVLGLTRINLWHYIVASFVCMAPGAIAYTWLGHAGREAIEGNTSAIRWGLLALGLLAGIVLVARLIGRLRNDRAISWITPDELAARLGQGDAPVIVDVRGPDEYSGPLGHIEGAVNIPLDSLDEHLPELAHQGRSIVTVCKTDKRSANAANRLLDRTDAAVSVLRGGMDAWTQRRRRT